MTVSMRNQKSGRSGQGSDNMKSKISRDISVSQLHVNGKSCAFNGANMCRAKWPEYRGGMPKKNQKLAAAA